MNQITSNYQNGQAAASSPYYGCATNEDISTYRDHRTFMAAHPHYAAQHADSLAYMSAYQQQNSLNQSHHHQAQQQQQQQHQAQFQAHSHLYQSGGDVTEHQVQQHSQNVAGSSRNQELAHEWHSQLAIENTNGQAVSSSSPYTAHQVDSPAHVVSAYKRRKSHSGGRNGGRLRATVSSSQQRGQSIEESITYKDEDIEHTSTQITVRDTVNEREVTLSNAELTLNSVRQLNKLVAGFPKRTIAKLKQRRRTLKNRGYAQNCRHKRLEQKYKLEHRNEELYALSKRQQAEIELLNDRLVQSEQEVEKLRARLQTAEMQLLEQGASTPFSPMDHHQNHHLHHHHHHHHQPHQQAQWQDQSSQAWACGEPDQQPHARVLAGVVGASGQD